MTAKLTAPLRRAPATVPALGAIALCVVWATDQSGYPVTHWAPGGLILLALLAIAALAVRRPLAGISPAARIALACLAGYTAFSYLTILWADAPGEALEGSDRTLLYLLVFALFASWRQHGPTAATLLIVWTLSVAGLAVFVLLHIDGATAGELRGMVPGGRLSYPSGYPNANAAEWLMAMWPALLMARERRLHWSLRGLLAGSAVLLAEVALLSQSRGSLLATPLVLVLVFALLPGRTRTFVALIPVAGGIALAAPAVLKVGNHLTEDEVIAANVHHATALTALAAALVAVVFAAGAALESSRRLSRGDGQLVHRVTTAAALVALVVVVAGGLAAAGNPIKRLDHAWHSFKGGYGEGGGDRLLSGLGSSRYDFYRVALDEFSAHPVGGIGVDNFQQQYLRKRHSAETPRYPHSIEMRVLSQTGLVGALLALAGLIAALWAAMRAARGPDALAAAAAAAALAGFGYWVVHGSADWLWEFAGLGAPAFALLGLVCSLDPGGSWRSQRTSKVAGSEPGELAGREDLGRSDSPRWADGDEPERGAASGRGAISRPLRVTAITASVALALVAALAFAGPWLSTLQVQSAARQWPSNAGDAYSRLDQAAKLDPFSDQPYLVAGSIALRLGELDRAEAQFAKALDRVPGDAYATLERGAIASTRGRRTEALRLLHRAAELNPRDPLTREALHLAESGRGVSVDALNRVILEKAEELS